MDKTPLTGKRKYIVGAYATSPNLFEWDEKSETIYYDKLKELPLIKGLELPYWGNSLHQFDDKWLLSNLHQKWQNVITCVPGTMKYLVSDPQFGLASINNESRKGAIDFYNRLFNCTKVIKDKLGNKSVSAIYITSSPYKTDLSQYANKKYLELSLTELATWDWGNTKILIEHCDAFNKENPEPKKGFLSLENEIETINTVNNICQSNISIVINWGRSVIEHRNVAGAIKHIKLAKENNLLAGIMFSGTTDQVDNIYGAWSDLHMPPATFADYKYFEPQSLMTFGEIKRTLSTCDLGLLEFLGIKILIKQKVASLDRRVAVNRETMDLLQKAIDEINIQNYH